MISISEKYRQFSPVALVRQIEASTRSGTPVKNLNFLTESDASAIDCELPPAKALKHLLIVSLLVSAIAFDPVKNVAVRPIKIYGCLIKLRFLRIEVDGGLCHFSRLADCRERLLLQ